ncbi:MAG: aminopeptidase P family protein [Myxococcales bacterium]|nr:aminopeptidase P family protein [Myxococcales bacterium]
MLQAEGGGASAGLFRACAARRAGVLRDLEGPALLPAGQAAPRNYPANRHPFRASSHFLHLVGAALPGAWLLLDGEATLYVPTPGPDDALWHGPVPGPGALAEQLGLAVRPLEALARAVGDRAPATVTAQDAATRSDQGAWARDAEADARLADALIASRLVHDEAAIAELRDAAAATVAAHLAGMGHTAPGRREWAVRAEMEAALGRRGMGTAYGSIVSVHGEVLHNEHHDGVLAAGDLLLADVGAETRTGYAGDVTRTWPVSGRFSPTQRAVYEVVLAAQAAAIDRVAPGVRYRDVHLAAARRLTEGLVDLGILRGDVDGLVEDDVHALFFPHGIGHLLGLDVHDMEDLGDRAGYAPGRTRSGRFGLGYLRLDRDLQPGMAVTIEPGFYQVPALLADDARTARAGDRLVRSALARFSDVRGIRIEDDVLVTATGHEVLTRALPSAPESVEAEVGRCIA